MGTSGTSFFYPACDNALSFSVQDLPVGFYRFAATHIFTLGVKCFTGRNSELSCLGLRSGAILCGK
jgi:hypothetical protein